MGIFHFAYLDPGTGSILIQGLIGGFLGVVYIGRKYIARLITTIKSAFLGRQKGKSLEASDKL